MRCFYVILSFIQEECKISVSARRRKVLMVGRLLLVSYQGEMIIAFFRNCVELCGRIYSIISAYFAGSAGKYKYFKI